jgi:excisionase family DNA binding protein
VNRDPLLAPEKIAEVLGISVAMVYKIIRKGLLPVVRIGTACRVIPADLAAYIGANRTTEPRAPRKRTPQVVPRRGAR